MNRATHENDDRIMGTYEVFGLWVNDRLQGTHPTQAAARRSAGFLCSIGSAGGGGGERRITRHVITLPLDSETIVDHLPDGVMALSDDRAFGGHSSLTPSEAMAKLQAKQRPGDEIQAVQRWEGFTTHYLQSKTGKIRGACAIHDSGKVTWPPCVLTAKHWFQDDHR